MKNVHLYLSVHYVRVLGKMGEFEGELRERLSSLRFGKARPFLPQAATRRAAAGRARCDEGSYGHRQQSKGVPSPSKP